jgi:hypothetical protein
MIILSKVWHQISGLSQGRPTQIGFWAAFGMLYLFFDFSDQILKKIVENNPKNIEK